MGSLEICNAMDSLNPQNFNEFVKSRSREPSPLRSPSPIRFNLGPVAQTGMDDNIYNIPTPLENIGCQELLEYKCSYCGWLRKRRNLKTLNQILSWPQAYVVLHEGCFYYFKNERARSAAGKFSLYGYNSVFRASEIPVKESPWSFKIVHSHQEFKTYYFAAASEKEMKEWMCGIKKAMLNANGKSAIYGKVFTKDKEEKSVEANTDDNKINIDDNKFYQDIEQSIYDDSSKFIPTQDYTKKCSVKRENEDSDDDELEIINPHIDKRPPCPIPLGQCKLMSEPPLRPPNKPPRIMEPPDHLKPATPPRTRRQPTRDTSPHPPTKKMEEMKAGEDTSKPKRSPKRRGSYEKTDTPNQKSPVIKPTKFDYKTGTNLSSGGGSTGEDEPDHFDPEEYWASIHFDDTDKTKAHDIIQAIGENGVYLVRPENSGTGKVLVVYACDQTKKYRIQQGSDEQYFLAKEGFKGASLEEMLYYYYENELPTISQKLIQPYKLHPKYKNLKY